MQVVEDDATTPFFYDSIDKNINNDKMLCDRIELSGNDVYKELLLRGYEYGESSSPNTTHLSMG
jgi:hypothetical protein